MTNLKLLLAAIDAYAAAKEAVRTAANDSPERSYALIHAVYTGQQIFDIREKIRAEEGAVMGKRKVDKHGAHLHGCECRECTKTNATCPQCSRKYWAEPAFPELNECPRCMWSPVSI